jgi:hypothetical protein
MVISQDQFELLINDPEKFIEEDIEWKTKENHYASQSFRIKIQSKSNYPIFINGTYNLLSKRLSYTIIHKGIGKRIYGLDMGLEHKNPDGKIVGEIHKHRWTIEYEDQKAYFPEDITANAENPVQVWKQFCEEAKIKHHGYMSEPKLLQTDLFADF